MGLPPRQGMSRLCPLPLRDPCPAFDSCEVRHKHLRVPTSQHRHIAYSLLKRDYSSLRGGDVTIRIKPVARPEAAPALALKTGNRFLRDERMPIRRGGATIKAAFLDLVNVISEYDKAFRSPSAKARSPSAVSTIQHPVLLQPGRPLLRYRPAHLRKVPQGAPARTGTSPLSAQSHSGVGVLG